MKRKAERQGQRKFVTYKEQRVRQTGSKKTCDIQRTETKTDRDNKKL